MTPISRNFTQDSVSYDVACIADRTLRFQITGYHTESSALVFALDKIGYHIMVDGADYYLVDADDHTIVESVIVDATTLSEAFQHAFSLIGWEISEPIQLIGGSMGDGFGEMTEDNR